MIDPSQFDADYSSLSKRAKSFTQKKDLGSELPPDVVEFGKALEYYKRAHNRPHPHYSEVFEVFVLLGYSRETAVPFGTFVGLARKSRGNQT